MVAKLAKDVLSRDVDLNILNKFNDSENFYVLNISKFNKTFEFTPCVPLEISLIEMLKSIG